MEEERAGIDRGNLVRLMGIGVVGERERMISFGLSTASVEAGVLDSQPSDDILIAWSTTGEESELDNPDSFSIDFLFTGMGIFEVVWEDFVKDGDGPNVGWGEIVKQCGSASKTLTGEPDKGLLRFWNVFFSIGLKDECLEALRLVLRDGILV